MSPPAALELDARLRAALLWDVPGLAACDDAGCRQWRSAFTLDDPATDGLHRDDLLSVAAHAVFAALTGDLVRAAELRDALAAQGPSGALFAHLLALGLSLESEEGTDALREAGAIVDGLADVDLRARLRLRLVELAHPRGRRDVARAAAAGAVADTAPDTRVGIVARRWAAHYGVEVKDFGAPAPDGTPHDPLLELPWVRRAALEAAAALAVDDAQHELAGVWDAEVRLGRTPFDELLSAHAQAEWCGALDVRETIRKVLVAHVLAHPARHAADQVRWAVAVWASSAWGKRTFAAVCRNAGHMSAAQAAELVSVVARDPDVPEDAAAEVALAVWDRVDDDAADAMLRWAAALEPVPAHRHARQLIAALLRRRPETWAEHFLSTDARTRAWMLGALQPADVTAFPAVLLDAAAAQLEDDAAGVPRDVCVAVQFASSAIASSDREGLDAEAVLRLLSWEPQSVIGEVVTHHVDLLVAAAGARLERAAAGTGALPAREPGELLGRLAAHLPGRNEAVVEALLRAAAHQAADARWQLGALEGLAVLRRAGRLSDDDLARVRELRPRPAARRFGERIGATALRADQLRVLAPDLTTEDVTWLAARAREEDLQGRVFAMHTLGEVGDVAPETADWTLAGGLFDRSDDVVGAALAAIRRRGLPSGDGPRDLARSRLRGLLGVRAGSVRREVVALAVARPELGLDALVEAARHDPSWTVRRAAQQARVPA